jgi:hypothetical protein
MSPQLAEFLVRLHGKRWRERYGTEFTALLVELPATPRTIADALWSALTSRGAEIAIVFGALIACLAIGYVNLNANEIQPPLLLIFVANAVFIVLRPRLAWFWMALFGLTVVASYVIVAPFGIAGVDPPKHTYEALIALVPSVVEGLLVLGARAAIIGLRRSG